MKAIGTLPAGTVILGIRTFRGMLVIATDRGVYHCGPDGELEEVSAAGRRLARLRNV